MGDLNAQTSGTSGTPSPQTRQLRDFVQEREQLAQQRQQEGDFPNSISLRQTNLELLLGHADFQGSELIEKTRYGLYSACQLYGDGSLKAKDSRQAARAYEQALKAASAGRAPDHPDVIEARDEYAKDLELLGHEFFRDAANTFKQNYEIRKKLYGRADRRTAATEDSRAEILAELDEEDQQSAAEIYKENLKLYQAETLVSPNDASINDLIDSTKCSLAMVLEKLGSRNLAEVETSPKRKKYLFEAKDFFEDVLRYRKQNLGGGENKDTVFVRSHLARVLYHLRHFDEARRQFSTNRENAHLLSAEEERTMRTLIQSCEQAQTMPPDFESDAGPSDKPVGYVTSVVEAATKQMASKSASRVAEEEETKLGDIKRRQTFDRIAQNEVQGRYSRQAQPQTSEDDTYSPRLGVLHSKDGSDANGWLSGLRKTHGLLETYEDKTRKEYQHVKIAILDSGIDGTLQCFKHSTRIMAWKSWVKGDDTTDVRFDKTPTQRGDLIASTCQDEIGHGTHAAALLMQINPLAEIYIARVTKEKKNVEPEDVASAIEYASKTWQVDIISMSLGFQRRSQSIEDAVSVARGRKVLMFAAASNDGMNHPSRLFPADLDDVVCVSAANRKGKVADGQANPVENKNYTTLGVEVSSKWPRKFFPAGTKEDDLVKISSGSSIATAIMSASASLFFEFTRQEAVRSKDFARRMMTAEKSMKQAQGMRTVLNANMVLTGDYRYVVPWKVLDKKMLSSGAFTPREYARYLILGPLSENGFDFQDG